MAPAGDGRMPTFRGHPPAIQYIPHGHFGMEKNNHEREAQ